MAKSFRACPRHGVQLVEGRDRRLWCAQGHPVRAWAVFLAGQVVGAGRLETTGGHNRRNCRGAVWLAPGFPRPAELLELIIEAAAERHRLAVPREPLPSAV